MNDVAYDVLERQVRELTGGESDFVANAANFAALVFQELPDVNWAGFYRLLPSGELLLGPFCGPPACVRLPAGRGVCAAAVAQKASVVVDDVAAFDGHVVCDAASRSEIAVPFFTGERLAGVFDIDSPSLARFDDRDRAGIELLVRAFSESAHAPAA